MDNISFSEPDIFQVEHLGKRRFDSPLKNTAFTPDDAKILYDRDFSLTNDEDLIIIQSFYCYYSNDILQSLKRIEERIKLNDTKRLIRALEVYKVTGTTITEFQRRSKEKEKKLKIIALGTANACAGIVIDLVSNLNERHTERLRSNQDLVILLHRTDGGGKAQGTSVNHFRSPRVSALFRR